MGNLRVNDLLGVGLVLISIFIIKLALNEMNTLVKTIGLVGALITILVEIIYIIQVWRKK